MNDRLLREQIKYEKEYRDFQKKTAKFSMIAGLGQIPASMMAGQSSLASAINMPMSGYSTASRQKRLMYERQVDPKGYGGRALGMFDQVGKLAWTVPMSMALMGKAFGLGKFMPDKMRTLNSSLFNPFGPNKGYLASKGSNWATNALGIGTADLQTKAAAKMAKSLGLGSGAQNFFGSMLGGANTVASGLGSMAPMLALMGLKIGSGIMKARRIAKYKATRQSTHKIEKSHSLSGQLDGYLQTLISSNQLPPVEQVKIQLLRWIESHTSVLPEIYSELDYKEQQKTKNVRGTDRTYNRHVLGNDDRGTFAKAFDATEHWLTRTSAKYDPVSQLINFIFTRKTPKQTLEDIDHAYGKSAKLTREDKVQARNLGVSNSWQALLKRDSKTISDMGESYEEKMMNLSRAQFDVLRLAGSELVSIRRTGFGIAGNPFQNPDDTKSVFRRLVDGIKDIALNIPGLNAVGNIAKLGFNVGRVGFNVARNLRHPIRGIRGLIGRNREPAIQEQDSSKLLIESIYNLNTNISTSSLQQTNQFGLLNTTISSLDTHIISLEDKLVNIFTKQLSENNVLKVKIVNPRGRRDNTVFIGNLKRKRRFRNSSNTRYSDDYDNQDVQAMASGGIVTHHQITEIGEVGPEAVVPLPNGRSIPVSFTGRGRRGNRNFGTEMNEIKIAQKEKEDKEYNTDVRLTLHSIAKSLNPDFKPKSKNEKKENSLWDLFKSIVGAIWSGISALMGAIGSMMPGGGFGAAMGAGAVATGVLAYKGTKSLGKFAMKGVKAVGGMLGIGGAAKAATAGAGAVTAGEVGAGVGAAATKAPGVLGKSWKFLKGAGKLGLKALGPALLAYDAYEGWNESGKYFGLKEGEEATLGQKFSGMLGNVLSLGLAPETFAPFIHKLGSGLQDAFNAVPWKEIGDIATKGAKAAWSTIVATVSEYAPKIQQGFLDILTPILIKLKHAPEKIGNEIKRPTGEMTINSDMNISTSEQYEREQDRSILKYQELLRNRELSKRSFTQEEEWNMYGDYNPTKSIDDNTHGKFIDDVVTYGKSVFDSVKRDGLGNPLSIPGNVEESLRLSGQENSDKRAAIDVFNKQRDKILKTTVWLQDAYELFAVYRRQGMDEETVKNYTMYLDSVEKPLMAEINHFNIRNGKNIQKELYSASDVSNIEWSLVRQQFGDDGKQQALNDKAEIDRKAFKTSATKLGSSIASGFKNAYNSSTKYLANKGNELYQSGVNYVTGGSSNNQSSGATKENHGFMGGIVDSMTGFIKNLFGGSTAYAATGTGQTSYSDSGIGTSTGSRSSERNSFSSLGNNANTSGPGFTSSGSLKWSKNYNKGVQDVINATANKYGIDPNLFTTMAYVESNGDPSISRGAKGAKGLFQFIPGTARDYGIAGNELNMYANADAAARYIKDNSKILTKANIPINATNLYLAHQQGAGGLTEIINAIRTGRDVSSDTRKRMANNFPPGANLGRNFSVKDWYDGWNNRFASVYSAVSKTSNSSAGQGSPLGQQSGTLPSSTSQPSASPTSNVSTPGQSGITQAQTSFNDMQLNQSLPSTTGSDPLKSEATKQFDQKRKLDLGNSEGSDSSGTGSEEPIVDHSVDQIIASLFRNSSESVNRNFQNYGIENATSFA